VPCAAPCAQIVLDTTPPQTPSHAYACPTLNATVGSENGRPDTWYLQQEAPVLQICWPGDGREFRDDESGLETLEVKVARWTEVVGEDVTRGLQVRNEASNFPLHCA
jgi:hypothetical protein